jgi:predicted alpha/beta-fold hydrolase
LTREYSYRAPWWLRNPHAQTIWGRLFKRVPHVATRSEILSTPDGDSVELHHLDGSEAAPRVLLLHGLEGSRESHYVDGMMLQAARRSWSATLLVFRGCGSAPNTAPRFYHSGETSDLDFVFSELTRRRAPVTFVAGVSLGGNVLLKWLGERGSLPSVRAAAAVSVPYDLEAGARKISSGFARVYDRNFVRSLRRKALAKLARHPALFDGIRACRARTIYEFDESVTAPVHGFANARDYYAKSSAIGFLDRVRVPTLLLSARDDPFLPVQVLEEVSRRARHNRALHIEFHGTGGHVGFVGGSPFRPFYYAEWRVFQFFDDAMEQVEPNGYD